jgi:hypothetical protein
MKGLNYQAFFFRMNTENWEIKLTNLIAATAFFHGLLYLFGTMAVFMPPIPIDMTVLVIISLLFFRASSKVILVQSISSVLTALSLFFFYARDQWINSLFFDANSIRVWEQKSSFFILIFIISLMLNLILFAYHAKEKGERIFFIANILFLAFSLFLDLTPFYAIIPTALGIMYFRLSRSHETKDALSYLAIYLCSIFVSFRFLLLLTH